jgi:hypothetical protein
MKAGTYPDQNPLLLCDKCTLWDRLAACTSNEEGCLY